MRKIAIVAGAAAIGLATLLVASPASAATLPSGQRITVAYNSPQFAESHTTQLLDIDPATAAGTAVGSPDPSPYPIAAIDVDDDGHGYATGFVAVDDETNAATLWVVDANTGTFSSPVTIEIPMIGSDVGCPGIDYTGGRILIACNYEPDGPFVTLIGSVDPATGDVDVLLLITEDNETTTEFTSLAMSPAGVLWAFGAENSSPFAAIVDVETWSLGEQLPIINDDETIDGADFDRDGQLFASVRDIANDPALATVDLGTGVVSVVAAYPFVELTGGASAITVWGHPALPATGPAEIVPLGLGTALLFLAGAAFIATGRIQRAE